MIVIIVLYRCVRMFKSTAQSRRFFERGIFTLKLWIRRWCFGDFRLFNTFIVQQFLGKTYLIRSGLCKRGKTQFSAGGLCQQTHSNIDCSLSKFVYFSLIESKDWVSHTIHVQRSDLMIFFVSENIFWLNDDPKAVLRRIQSKTNSIWLV